MKNISNKDLLVTQLLKWVFITFGYSFFVKADQFFMLVPISELLFSGVSLIILIFSLKIVVNLIAAEYGFILIMALCVFLVNEFSYTIIGRTIPSLDIIINKNLYIGKESLFLFSGDVFAAFFVLIIGIKRKLKKQTSSKL